MQIDDILDTKLYDVDLKTKIKGFIEVAKQGIVNKEDVLEYCQEASRKVSRLRMVSMELRSIINSWGADVEDTRGIYKAIISKYNTKEEHRGALAMLSMIVGNGDVYNKICEIAENKLAEEKNNEK